MLMSNDWEGLPGEILEIPHDFVVDIKTLVLVNYDLTVQAIEGEEDKALNFEVGPSDLDSSRSIISSIVNSHEELRVAARNLAVVGLVTRFQHWLETFVSQQKLTPGKEGKVGRVVKLLNALNGRFAEGPVPIEFFKGIVDLRDSIIHANAQAEWDFGEGRKVADEYRTDFGTVALTSKQFTEAVQNCIDQVIWYDEQIRRK
jgi:hypothetical protein